MEGAAPFFPGREAARMETLTSPLTALRGIGPQKAKVFEKLEIRTLGDLLRFYPRAYDDRRETKKISELIPGESACVAAMIASPPTLAHIRKGMDLIKVRAVDETGVLDLTFFNQSWLKNSLQVGQTYLFYGRAEGSLLRKSMASPIVEREGLGERTGRIVPIYPLTAGLSQLFLSRTVRQALDECGDAVPELLPAAIRRENALCSAAYAVENIHFPEGDEALGLARRRLAFEELFLFALGLAGLRSRRSAVTVPPMAAVDMAPFYAALPFSLTGAQRRSIDEALGDMRSGLPMNRLCQGDVGSGKTMVAAACVYFAARNGRQAALMAPTEILARQHYETLSPLLEPLGLRCALLTGSTGVKARRETNAALAAGDIDLAIGTHALLTGTVTFRDLGLVVTDEQHRFGVAQRAALAEKGLHPHTLVMSATPIPRTLALILYGDLDVSLIDELPPGRQPIETFAVPGSYRPRIYAFLRKHIAQGRQAYIVCPMVESGEEGGEDAKAVKDYASQLQKEVFPDLRVAFVHGKMKPKEKEAVMAAFAAGETDLLVSTTVIEVGVDVPNAAVMVVENAERFGLSQLHQLRGRVGRGKHQSYCILISDNQNEETRQRLKILTKTNDGFRLAEEDLRLRGPGDFFGVRQHGLPGLRVADLGCDAQLLQSAQKSAETLLAGDPELAHSPALRDRVAELFARNAETMN